MFDFGDIELNNLMAQAGIIPVAPIDEGDIRFGGEGGLLGTPGSVIQGRPMRTRDIPMRVANQEIQVPAGARIAYSMRNREDPSRWQRVRPYSPERDPNAEFARAAAKLEGVIEEETMPAAMPGDPEGMGGVYRIVDRTKANDSPYADEIPRDPATIGVESEGSEGPQPFYMVERAEIGPNWKPTGGTVKVDPTQVVGIRTVPPAVAGENPEEKPVRLADVVHNLQNEYRTPVITATGLKRMLQQGTFRPVTAAERAEIAADPVRAGYNRNAPLVGYRLKPRPVDGKAGAVLQKGNQQLISVGSAAQEEWEPVYAFKVPVTIDGAPMLDQEGEQIWEYKRGPNRDVAGWSQETGPVVTQEDGDLLFRVGRSSAYDNQAIAAELEKEPALGVRTINKVGRLADGTPKTQYVSAAQLPQLAGRNIRLYAPAEAAGEYAARIPGASGDKFVDITSVVAGYSPNEFKQWAISNPYPLVVVRNARVGPDALTRLIPRSDPATGRTLGGFDVFDVTEDGSGDPAEAKSLPVEAKSVTLLNPRRTPKGEPVGAYLVADAFDGGNTVIGNAAMIRSTALREKLQEEEIDADRHKFVKEIGDSGFMADPGIVQGKSARRIVDGVVEPQGVISSAMDLLISRGNTPLEAAAQIVAGARGREVAPYLEVDGLRMVNPALQPVLQQYQEEKTQALTSAARPTTEQFAGRVMAEPDPTERVAFRAVRMTPAEAARDAEKRAALEQEVVMATPIDELSDNQMARRRAFAAQERMERAAFDRSENVKRVVANAPYRSSVVPHPSYGDLITYNDSLEGIPQDVVARAIRDRYRAPAPSSGMRNIDYDRYAMLFGGGDPNLGTPEHDSAMKFAAERVAALRGEPLVARPGVTLNPGNWIAAMPDDDESRVITPTAVTRIVGRRYY